MVYVYTYGLLMENMSSIHGIYQWLTCNVEFLYNGICPVNEY